jgi:hypothetical protein
MAVVNIECSMRKFSNFLFRLKILFRKPFKRSIQYYKNIPIIINNFNRLEYLKLLIEWLENAGYKNIYIIDNQSTYPPLLSYYKTLPYTIFKLSKNMGYKAIWDTHVFLNFKEDYYVYTDPDILPIKDCPDDILEYFISLLKAYPEAGKIGVGLKTDDLPDWYLLKNRVIEYEKKYWEVKINNEVYEALVDTTFALYRPGAKGDWELKAYRTDAPYLARHLPWYENTTQPTEEEKYYISLTNKNSLWYSKLKDEQA